MADKALLSTAAAHGSLQQLRVEAQSPREKVLCEGLYALHISRKPLTSCRSTRGSAGQLPSQRSRKELGVAVPGLYVHLHSLQRNQKQKRTYHNSSPSKRKETQSRD